MVDVVSVLLWSLQLLAGRQHPRPGLGLVLGLLRPGVVPVLRVWLRALPGAWDTA